MHLCADPESEVVHPCIMETSPESQMATLVLVRMYSRLGEEANLVAQRATSGGKSISGRLSAEYYTVVHRTVRTYRTDLRKDQESCMKVRSWRAMRWFSAGMTRRKASHPDQTIPASTSCCSDFTTETTYKSQDGLLCAASPISTTHLRGLLLQFDGV